MSKIFETALLAALNLSALPESAPVASAIGSKARKASNASGSDKSNPKSKASLI